MSKRILGLVFIALIVCTPLILVLQKPMSGWFDESHQPFFPREIAERLSAYQEFPVFWWNFLVLEPTPENRLATAAALAGYCAKVLDSDTSKLIRNLPCGMSLVRLKPLLEEWSLDLPRRKAAPDAKTAAQEVNTSLARASLPVGREVLEILRVDPFGAAQEFERLIKKKIKSGFNFESGSFHEEATGKTVLPIQLSFPPTDTVKTRELVQLLEAALEPAGENASPAKPVLIGAHHSTLENELTVKNDIQRVSVLGGVLLLVALAIIMVRGHWRLLIFFPPLLVSTAAAVAWTIVAFGSIHGLALAFGPGVIGMSMDYAVHAAFAPTKRKATWLANFLGVLTTMTVISVGMLSSLPVLKQLMFFSGAGLLIGFIVFYAFHEFFPALFVEKAFFGRLPLRRPLAVVALALVIIAFSGALHLKLAFNMSDLNFETAQTSRLQKWIFVDGNLRPPYLEVFRLKSERSPLVVADEQRVWGRKHGLAMDSIGDFLPAPDEQAAHIESWQNLFCGAKGAPWLSKSSATFFAPFFAQATCGPENQPRRLLASETVPGYLSDFQSGERWITLWFPDSPKQVTALKERSTEIASLGEMAALFPKILTREISWMAPITFALSLILLYIYYRNTILVFCAVLPFFTGVGTYIVASWFIEMKVSFITLIGFIMVFGFSLDYGIFATDSQLGPEKDPAHGDESRSALTVTSLMTVAGVTPLMLAEHPAMKHLGNALVYGSIGTYLGAIWGVPFLFSFLRRFVSEASK